MPCSWTVTGDMAINGQKLQRWLVAGTCTCLICMGFASHSNAHPQVVTRTQSSAAASATTFESAVARQTFKRCPWCRTDNAVKNRWASLTKKHPELLDSSPSSVPSASAASSFSGSEPSRSTLAQSSPQSLPARPAGIPFSDHALCEPLQGSLSALSASKK